MKNYQPETKWYEKMNQWLQGIIGAMIFLAAVVLFAGPQGLFWQFLVFLF